MDECIFCKIINDKAPSFKVYDDDKITAFLPLNPIALGHILIVPKKHYKNALDIPAELMIDIMHVIKLLAKKLVSAYAAEGFNISSNVNEAAGQTVFHVHWHLIPRSINDGLKSWPGLKLNDKTIEEIAKKLT